MNEIAVDFFDLADYEDFYARLKERLNLPEFFGDNLDALHDYISGYAGMPLHLEFINMSVDQLETFEELLNMLDEAEEEVEGFTFSYYLEQFGDE